MATPETNPRTKGRKSRFYKRKGFWLGLIGLGVVSGALGFVGFMIFSQPYRERAASYDLERINDLEIPSVIYDRNSKEIGRIFVQNRSVIPYSEIPETLIKALQAGEDSRFWKHKGVDFIGIARAVVEIVRSREVNQGASTVTQQLARNAYNLREEALKREEGGIQRKLVEAFLAYRIEQRYSKKEILEFYLNRIYFGSGYHGIRSASLGYFGKEPRDLNVEECAAIVGLIKNPTGLSPLNNLAGNKKSRDHVLDRMRDEGMISRKELKQLLETPVALNPKPLRRGTSHLYERVADEIRAALGDEALAAGGYHIHTTILAEAQWAAEESLRKSLAKAEARPGYSNPKHEDYRKSSGKAPEYLQGAVLMVDQETGDVLAHVGGRDYSQAPFDFIEMGRRPLGTAFFPFLYVAGFSNGLTPASVIDDEPMDNRSVMIGGREGVLGEWGMEVSSPTYEGVITPRRALENSKIAATVRFGQQAGLDKVVDTAKALGMNLPSKDLLPRLCVGWEPVSMKEAVRAIGAFGRGGRIGPSKLHFVSKVEDAGGTTVYYRESKTQPGTQAIQPAAAYQVHSMLAGSLSRGSSAGCLDGLTEKPFQGGGKGGTVAEFSDTWFLGYNSRVTCGVWTGFLQNSGRPIYDGAFSRDLAMPVWQATMNAASKAFPGEEVRRPANLVDVPVCRVSGQRATQFCYEMVEDPATHQLRSRSSAINELFRRGTESLPFCPVHSGTEANTLTLGGAPALDVMPVRPKSPALLGEDPYHSEQPVFNSMSQSGGVFRKRTDVLGSWDLDNKEEQIRLPQPKRLKIIDE